jgi:hypothetical protein
MANAAKQLTVTVLSGFYLLTEEELLAGRDYWQTLPEPLPALEAEV